MAALHSISKIHTNHDEPAIRKRLCACDRNNGFLSTKNKRAMNDITLLYEINL